MKKALIAVLVISGLSIFAPCMGAEKNPAKEQELGDLSREKKAFRNYSGEGPVIFSFCMEGHVFLMVSGNNSNFSSIIQVNEERTGKVVPKKCD